VARPSDVPGLGPDTPVAAAGPLLVAARLADVRRYEAPVAETLDADPIHDMRVATRRLRAALKLFDGAGGRELDRKVKRLQDALGDVRDVQVQLAWLATCYRRLHHRERPRMRAWITSPLRLREAALRTALRAWREQTAAEVSAAAAAITGRGRLGGKRPRKVLERRARRLAKLAREVRADPEPTAAHALRISAKKLRYTAELLEAAFPSISARLLGALVPLQETLGELHDADVRIARLGGLARRGAVVDRRAAARLLGTLRPERERLAATLVGELHRYSRDGS
jgi:CHAD domain-containing protein